MSSQIDICNLALNHLGMKGITSLTENNPSAIALNNYYNPCRDDTLSDYNWPFANVKAALVSVSDDVLELEWDYIYVYPTQALAIWNVYDESTVDNKWEQEFETSFQVTENRRVICSNLETAYVEYTRRLTDTSIYSPRFVMVFSYKLAASMAHTLTGDVDMGIKLLDIYNMYLGEAKRLGYQERKKKPKQTSSYVNSRG